MYDVDKGREVSRKGFVVDPGDWRRAAHKCSGQAYTAVTGAPGIFDTRIAYVAESGAGQAKVKRIAIMDSDGTNHRYLTAGDTMVLTPRLSPKAARMAYVSYAGGRPQVRHARRRVWQPAPTDARRRDQLRPTFLTGRKPHRLFDDDRRKQRYLRRQREGGVAAAPHDGAGDRH